MYDRVDTEVSANNDNIADVDPAHFNIDPIR